MVSEPNGQQQSQQRIPLELLRLSQSTRHYAAILRDTLPSVVALGESGGLLLDQINAALLQTEWGSVGSIQMAVSELIGEA